MKSELRRIATALQHLDTLDGPPPTVARRPTAAPRRLAITPRPRARVAAPGASPGRRALKAELPSLPNGPSRPASPLTPAPPRSSLHLSGHRHGLNPALVTSLLTDMQSTAQRWQQELQKILVDLQDLYLEGPIVAGWLESQPQATDPQLVARIAARPVSELASPGSGYRLCGFDAEGRVWSKYCPPDQVPGVSMAIARYQKLRSLLDRKQTLEQRLTELAETLIQIRSRLSDS